ncbi:Uncharacterized protein FWK35_00029694, partial [Aphis craccivora]
TSERQYNKLWSSTRMSKVFIMYTITLNGNSSELSCDFFPPIETNNSIPNINDKCYQIGFIYYEGKSEKTANLIYSLPTGSYELREIEAFYNINTRVYEKSASRVSDIIKLTTLKKKKRNFKYSKVEGDLTAEN